MSTPDTAAGRVRFLLLAAVALAAAGLLVNVFRPLAPPPLGTPTDLDAFSPALLARVADYRGSQRLVGLLGLLAGVAVPVAFVGSRRSRVWLAGALPRRRPALAAGSAAAVVVTATDLVTLPFDVWVGWFHERAFGFAAGSLPLWLRDRVLGLGIRLVVVALGAVMLWWIVQRAGETWHLWLVPVATGAAAILVLLQPLVVQPLFLSTRPLEAGPTRDAVAAVLAAAGESDLQIDVGDASTRTTRINAFVTGLGPSRRVVLYDTLLRLPADEVAYVVAHELAHREHQDLPRGVLLTASAALPVTWLLRRLRWRVSSDPAVLVAMAIAVLSAANLVGAPVANAVSRRAEAAADHRALELTGDPAVQVRLNRGFVQTDLADPAPPFWVTQLWGTHPSVGQRIGAAVDDAVREGLPVPSLDAVGG